MKRVLLVLMLNFYFIKLLGQGGEAEYKVELYDLNYRVLKGVKNSTTSHVLLEIIYNNNYRETAYFRWIKERGDEEQNRHVYSRQINKIPISIRTKVFVNFRTGTDAGVDLYNNIKLCRENFYSVDTRSPRMSFINFRIKVKPIH